MNKYQVKECKFLRGKSCSALACYDGRTCKAKDENGNIRYITTEAIALLEKEGK